MAKTVKSEEQLQSALFRCGDSIFRLLYLHAKRPEDVESLMEDVFLQYAVCEESFPRPADERAWLLNTAHCAAMDYYAKKLRRCPPDDTLRRLGRSLPFAVTKELCAVLRLHYSMLSPVALCCGDGESVGAAAKILKMPRGRVQRKLQKAAEKSGLSADDLREWCETVTLPEEIRRRVLYGVMNSMHDKHFSANSRARGFKRRLDRAIPFVALGVIVVAAAAVFAVRAGVFGAFTPSTALQGEVYSSSLGSAGTSSTSSSESASESSESHAAAPTATPEPVGDLARLSFPVFVPDESGLTQYNLTDVAGDAALVISEMAAHGAFPEDVSLVKLEYFQNGEVVSGIRSGEQVQVRITLTAALQEYLDGASSTAALEAIAKSFRAFYEAGDMTLATLEVYAGDAPVSVGGYEINCTALMYGELPVTAVIDAE